MTHDEHIQKLKVLHHNLDILLAVFLVHTGKLMRDITFLDLLKWSYEQTINPTAKPGEEKE